MLRSDFHVALEPFMERRDFLKSVYGLAAGALTRAAPPIWSSARPDTLLAVIVPCVVNSGLVKKNVAPARAVCACPAI
jgi:hypothetical protein